MALRIYTDPSGTEWKVWDVPPRFARLRSAVADRRSSVSPDSKSDQRRRSERRVTVAPPEWVHGWICFQSDSAKLRLCPLPEKWEDAGPEALERLRRRAVAVRIPSSR